LEMERRLGAPADGPQPREQQRRAYLEGEWGNPLTTSRTGARILNAFQVPAFTILPPRGVAVLTTIGRKTGKRRRNCVRAIRRGNQVFVVSLAGRYGGWYRNLAANPRAQLRMRGGWFRGMVREIEDEAELAQARQIYCDTVTFFDRIEYLNHRKGRPTRERIRALHTRWFAVCMPLVFDVEG
jgi:deazaflavin-dependent oxidoreductase (nitroreductase family)